MSAILEQVRTVRSTEVDLAGVCRPSALLGYFQDAATAQAQAFHMDRDYLVDQYHAAWLLVRVWYRLKAPIRQDDVITVRTWHRGASSLIIYRDFDVLRNGELVCEAVSAWVVADLDTRRMLRPKKIDSIAASPVPELVKDRELKLIHTPEDRTPVYTKTVRLSDLDVNGHMNNTKYADAALDALSPSELSGRYISSLQLNYSLECRPGEEIRISRKLENDSCYVDGEGADSSRKFEAILEFSSLPETALDGSR